MLYCKENISMALVNSWGIWDRLHSSVLEIMNFVRDRVTTSVQSPHHRDTRLRSVAVDPYSAENDAIREAPIGLFRHKDPGVVGRRQERQRSAINMRPTSWSDPEKNAMSDRYEDLPNYGADRSADTGQSERTPTPELSVIDANSTVSGMFTTTGSVQVFGAIDGEMVNVGDMFIAPGASVQSTIHAVNLVVAGTAIGTINCSERFEVLETGEVRGEVSAPAIIVHDGARVIGALRMSALEPHTEKTEEPGEPDGEE